MNEEIIAEELYGVALECAGLFVTQWIKCLSLIASKEVNKKVSLDDYLLPYQKIKGREARCMLLEVFWKHSMMA